MFWRRYPNFNDVVRHAPGPSPWYFTRDSPRVSGDAGPYRWSDAKTDFGASDETTGKTMLRDRDGAVRLILDFHCYVRPLANHRLLCWHEDAGSVAPGHRSIHLRLLNTDLLPVIKDPLASSRGMKPAARLMWFDGGEIAHVGIPLSLPDGPHAFACPEEFRVVDEVLMLGHATRGGRTSNFHDEMHLCIYDVRPVEKTVEVIPQHWFNRARLDFGYQWVTRVVRDPETGRIFGDGIRIRGFVLRRSGRRVAVWK